LSTSAVFFYNYLEFLAEVEVDMDAMAVERIKSTLQALADPEIAQHSRRFFKSGPGEYAEGDKFYGIRVPEQRKLAKKFAKDFDLASLSLLIKDDYHEARLTGVLILVLQYQKAKTEAEQKALVDFFLEHRDWVNNWDLVDSSAHKILGSTWFRSGITRSSWTWPGRITSGLSGSPS
jgi:3-methyladenine DNA glycosylase AlkD